MWTPVSSHQAGRREQIEVFHGIAGLVGRPHDATQQLGVQIGQPPHQQGSGCLC